MSTLRPIGRCIRYFQGRRAVRRFASAATVPLSDPHPSIPDAGSHSRIPPEPTKVTHLASGITVASIETYSPVSRLGLIVEAGSRFETEKNRGVTHYLRNSAFLSTSDYTAFRISRETEQLGGHLSATSTRDHFIYMGDCMRNDIGAMMEGISSVALNSSFFPWEVSNQTARVELDLKLAAESPTIGIMESVHKGAFRTTLGNSLYCSTYNLGKITSDHLHQFVSDHYQPKRMVVIGIGVNSDEFVKTVQDTFSSAKSPEKVIDKLASQYHGGSEHRVETGSELVHACLATEGVGLSSKDFLTSGLLQRILGVTPFIKWSPNTISRVNKAGSEAAGGNPAMVTCFNTCHSDSGLFGLYVVSHADDIRKVLSAAVNEFSAVAKGNISDAELTRAKNQLKASILMTHESQVELLEDIGTQILVNGTYTDAHAAADSVDKISGDDVVQVAKRFFGGKPTYAAQGNLCNTPYLDELRS